jgi:hypothetical protein
MKNSVFKPSVDTVKWLKATGVRMVRTFASSMVALLPTTAVAFGEVDWAFALSASVTSTIVIFFTCLAGVPEVKGGE